MMGFVTQLTMCKIVKIISPTRDSNPQPYDNDC